MSIQSRKSSDKTQPGPDARTQMAALCYRYEDGKLRFLIITSRRRGRWIMPKGWPMKKLAPHETAAREAFEEAGVVGKPSKVSCGIYSYVKMGKKKGDPDLPCAALVYPVKVKRLAKKFPEAGQRKRKWVSRKKAVRLLAEPELARIVAKFDPKTHG